MELEKLVGVEQMLGSEFMSGRQEYKSLAINI